MSTLNADAVTLEHPSDGFENCDPWFDDGNIIIRAGNKRFKVWKSVLSAHSVVFHDMFSLPQPAGAVDEVTLTDDPDVLQCMLSSLCCGKS